MSSLECDLGNHYLTRSSSLFQNPPHMRQSQMKKARTLAYHRISGSGQVIGVTNTVGCVGSSLEQGTSNECLRAGHFKRVLGKFFALKLLVMGEIADILYWSGIGRTQTLALREILRCNHPLCGSRLLKTAKMKLFTLYLMNTKSPIFSSFWVKSIRHC
jgi:hypothetical protein